MAAGAGFVSFLSDYGLDDEFVGVCKAVIWGLAPEVRIVDVTHGIAAHDVRGGALALARAAQYLPDGVVLAVVDPGVGSDRRGVAVEVGGVRLVGPDNGLLAPAVAMLGGAERVVSLTNPSYQLPAPGATFAGRDIFAPAAGHLAAGVEFGELGEEVDPSTLVPGIMPLPYPQEGAIAGEVLWVDRFGNLQLNLGPEELEAAGLRPGEPVEVRCGRETRLARWVSAYSIGSSGELLIVIDSYGLISLALPGEPAAEALGLRATSPVTLAVPTA